MLERYSTWLSEVDLLRSHGGPLVHFVNGVLIYPLRKIMVQTLCKQGRYSFVHPCLYTFCAPVRVWRWVSKIDFWEHVYNKKSHCYAGTWCGLKGICNTTRVPGLSFTLNCKFCSMSILMLLSTRHFYLNAHRYKWKNIN